MQSTVMTAGCAQRVQPFRQAGRAQPKRRGVVCSAQSGSSLPTSLAVAGVAAMQLAAAPAMAASEALSQVADGNAAALAVGGGAAIAALSAALVATDPNRRCDTRFISSATMLGCGVEAWVPGCCPSLGRNLYVSSSLAIFQLALPRGLSLGALPA